MIKKGVVWQDIELLLTIYRSKNLSETGKILGVDQSTVSRRLQQLEEELGITLFVRSRTGVYPTENVKYLIPHAEDVEQAIGHLERTAIRVRSEPTGVVRLALPETIADYLVVPALPSFLREYPSLRLELLTAIELVDLSRFEADIALRFVRPTQGELIAKSLGRAMYGIFASKDYLARCTHVRNPSELDWITWDKSRHYLPEAKWYQKHITVEPRIRCTRATTMLAGTLGGVGVALLAIPFATQLPTLQEIRTFALPRLSINLWLVGHYSMRGAPHVESVWGWLSSLFQGLQQGE